MVSGSGSFADVNAEETTFTTADKDTVIRAVYVQGYELTVENGTGSGLYKEGQAVTISASLPDQTEFEKWELTSGSGTIADPASAQTVFTMEAGAATVTAKVQEAQTFGDFVVSGGTAGTDYSFANDILTFTGSGSYTVRMKNGVTSTSQQIVVSSGSPTLTLSGVQIVTDEDEAVSAFQIKSSAGAVTVKLDGENKLLTSLGGTRGYAALQKDNTAMLTITSAQGDGSSYGSLYAETCCAGAAIGSGSGDVKNITISGGTITALNTEKVYGGCGAGIGAGGTASNQRSAGNAENITISGGVVTAASAYGAGIGGGGYKANTGTPGNGTNITITGGTVTSSSTNGGMGVGGGTNYSGAAKGTASNILVQGNAVIKQGGSQADTEVNAADIESGTEKYVSIIYSDASSVTDVAITPSETAAGPGETAQFTALLTGSGDKTQVWSVSGNESEGTTITQTGLLSVASDETADTLTVTVAAQADANKSASATVTVFRLTPTVSQWPEASDIVYGQTLADSALTGGSADVAGTFSWSDQTTLPSAGAAAYEVVFTPESVSYEAVTGTVSVETAKAVPTLSWEQASQSVSWTGSPAAVTPPEITLVNQETYSGTISYSYRKPGDTGYTEGLPAAVGTWQVKAAIPEQANYTGAVTAADLILTVTDTVASTGTITVQTDSWSSLSNQITFGKFYKDTQAVAITGEDDTGTDVVIAYLLADTQKPLAELETLAEADWTTYTGTFDVAPGKYIVYARITDESGNPAYISSEGLVVYEESGQDTAEVTCTYQGNAAKEAAVKLNGNTVSGVADADGFLTEGTDYTVSEETITLTASYLNTLAIGSHTLTVSYDPQGIQTDQVELSTTFQVKVNPVMVTDLSEAVEKVIAPEALAEVKNNSWSGDGYTAELKWNCGEDTYDFNTAYTATMTLTADENHCFADTESLLSALGDDAQGWNMTGTDGVLTLQKVFPKTRMEKIIGISDVPEDLVLTEHMTDAGAAAKMLADTVTVNLEVNGAAQLPVSWSCENFDTSPEAENVFSWTVSEDAVNETYDQNGTELSGSVTVKNPKALPVTVSVNENRTTVTYTGNPIDLSQLFAIDENAGEAVYTVGADSTGEGTINGHMLNVTKTGTFFITVKTASKGIYGAGTAMAKLTIEPRDIADAEVTLGDSLTANGKTQTQQIEKVTVKNSAGEEIEVTYTVSGNQGTEAGSYTMTITGTGNFTGTVVKTFVIAPAADGQDEEDGKESDGEDSTESDEEESSDSSGSSGKSDSSSGTDASASQSEDGESSASSVNTGDSSNLLLWLALLLLSSAGIVALRRRNDA